MSRHVFVGRLPNVIRKEELLDVFRGYGHPRILAMKTAYAFLEFSTLKDAADAVRDFNGRLYCDERLVVDFSRRHATLMEQVTSYSGSKPSYPEREAILSATPMSQRPFVTNPACRITIRGLPPSVDWKELKSWGSQCGQIYFAGVDRFEQGLGFLDYGSLASALHAIKTLRAKPLRGRKVQVTGNAWAVAGVNKSDAREAGLHWSPSPERERRKARDRKRGSRSPVPRRSPHRFQLRCRSHSPPLRIPRRVVMDHYSPQKGNSAQRCQTSSPASSRESDNSPLSVRGRRRESDTTYRTSPAISQYGDQKIGSVSPIRYHVEQYDEQSPSPMKPVIFTMDTTHSDGAK